MKNLFVFLTGLLAFKSNYAQNSISIGNDLNGIVSTRAVASGMVVSSFSNSNIKGTRYLFTDWTTGSVTSSNNEIYSNNYKFNFDKINQDIYAQDNKSKVSVVLDKSKVKRFTIGSSLFINSSSLKDAPHDIFYQVLVEDNDKISLYKLITTKFVKANPNDIMNVRTSNFSNEYIDDNKYYISVNNGELKKIILNENNIKKVLKDKRDKVDGYFNMNDSKEIDEKFLIELIQYVNQ